MQWKGLHSIWFSPWWYRRGCQLFEPEELCYSRRSGSWWDYSFLSSSRHRPYFLWYCWCQSGKNCHDQSTKSMSFMQSRNWPWYRNFRADWQRLQNQRLSISEMHQRSDWSPHSSLSSWESVLRWDRPWNCHLPYSSCRLCQCYLERTWHRVWPGIASS